MKRAIPTFEISFPCGGWRKVAFNSGYVVRFLFVTYVAHQGFLSNLTIQKL